VLSAAYIRRKQFEGLALLAAFGKATQGGGGGDGRVPAEAMIAMMGGF
jgi:hypothetical protein